MTRAELHEKVTKFVHGVDSHGELLIPYRQDWWCTWCDKLTDFIMGLSPKEECEPLHLFNCPTCKVQGYCDGVGYCLHETHSQQ